jgi:uridine phosphorylase
LKRLFDGSGPVVTPDQLIRTFTRKNPEELRLPRRAIITVHREDARFLRKGLDWTQLPAWAPLRRVYLLNGRETVITRSWFGGPNIAATVEEFSAFGVEEFCLWGYMGGISPTVSLGDVIVATGAVREEGVSHHYLDSDTDLVYSGWARDWEPMAGDFKSGVVWSCDALYRETRDKVNAFRSRGVLGVEMEVASFYAVCAAKGLKAVAILVVSDLLFDDAWKPGFFNPAFRKGARRLGVFLKEHAII